jgi:two-component system NtrC family sensor kinase
MAPEVRSDHPAPPGRPARTVRSRPRLFYLYYVLAAFDLLTVSLSLYVIDRITGIYADSVNENQQWAERTADYAELARLAAEVNAPGNDVFESGRTAVERNRLDAALQSFRERSGLLRVELTRNVPAETATDLLVTFSAMDRAVNDMVAEAGRIFASIDAGDMDTAGAHMAEMDRRFLAVNDSIQALGASVRAIQAARFADQLDRSAATRRLELVIAGLMLVMIGGVTFYGHRLAGQVRREAAYTERVIEERTAELAASNEQLRLAERLASIGTLSAGLGHDMNNVLFPIRCRLDVLEGTTDDPAAREELALIRRSIAYLQQLSDGLRLLARDANAPDDAVGRRGSTNLESWWSEVEPLMRTALPKRARLEAEIAPHLPEAVIEPHQLTQVVFNLVVNAGEAIEGDGVVRVWTRAGSEGTTVFIGVSDTGDGMTEATRRRALDPFFTTKKRGLSTGLGLAVVHAVVSAAGGSIDIASTPGEGTTITITLPAVAPRRDEQNAAPLAVIAIGDERIASFVSGVLRASGYEPRRAVAGEPPDPRAALWVCDHAVAPESLRRHAAANPRLRIVVYGDADAAQWRGLPVSVVSSAGGVQAMRAAIERQPASARREVA